MTAILALACFITGFIGAWLLRTTFCMAQISWSQERMQRKVHYWQEEAIRARIQIQQAAERGDFPAALIGAPDDEASAA
jgi:hypothetical protein